MQEKKLESNMDQGGQGERRNLVGTLLGKWGRKRGMGYLVLYNFNILSSLAK